MLNTVFTFLLLIFLCIQVNAGPLAYGVCQTGCNAMVVACYAAGGLTFGTVTAGLGAPGSDKLYINSS